MALVLVMGVPGAGKTTLSKQLKLELGNDAVRISFDDIFSYCRVSGECCYGSMLGFQGFRAYNSYGRIERRFCEATLRNALKNVKKTGYFLVPPYEAVLWDPPPKYVIVDDIFYLQSMRRPLKKMAYSNSMHYFIVHVDTPLALALERNANRPAKVCIPESTIRRIFDQMEFSSEEMESLLTFQPGDNISALAATIKDAVANLVTPGRRREQIQDSGKNIAKDGCDVWQKLEIDLRRCIGDLLREHSNQQYTGAIGKAKKEIIAEFKAENKREWEREELKEVLWEKLTC